MTFDDSNHSSIIQRPHRRSDPFNRLTWAGLLIVTGIVLLAAQTGYLPRLGNAGIAQWIALGSGAVLLIAETSRLFVVSYSRPSTTRMILGTALAGYGILRIFQVSEALIWPAGIIMFGIIVFVRSLTR